MERNSQVHREFKAFVHEVGISHGLHSENTKELVIGEFKKKVNKYEVHKLAAQSHSP